MNNIDNRAQRNNIVLFKIYTATILGYCMWKGRKDSWVEYASDFFHLLFCLLSEYWKKCAQGGLHFWQRQGLKTGETDVFSLTNINKKILPLSLCPFHSPICKYKEFISGQISDKRQY